MFTFVRAIRLLALSLWIGGIAFFAFVLAPVAFSTLPSPHLAGTVVRSSISILHYMGLACGAILLIATAFLMQAAPLARRRLLTAQFALAALMLLLTAVSQFSMIPPMERDRLAAGGDIDALAPANPARIHFERLHKASEQVEGVILLFGLVSIVALAREQTPSTAPPA